MVSVRFHLQDTADYCGAAVAMMVAGLVDAPYEEQDVLYQRARALVPHEAAFAVGGISPEGLAALLNDRLAAAQRPERYVVRYHETAVDAVRRMLASELSTGLPAAVPAGEADHWLLHTGHASESWAGGRVTHLILHDPAGGGPPPPVKPRHSKHDVCGAGVAHGQFAMYYDRPWAGLLLPLAEGFPSVVVEPTTPVTVPELADAGPPAELWDQLPSFLGSDPRGLRLGPLESLLEVDEPGRYERLRPILDAAGGRVGWQASGTDGGRSVGLYAQTLTEVSIDALLTAARRHAGRAAPDGAVHERVWRRAKGQIGFEPYRRIGFEEPGRDVLVRVDGGVAF